MTEKEEKDLDKYIETAKEQSMKVLDNLDFEALDKAADIIKKAMDKGLIIISAGSSIIRFVPPLIITKENVDEMIGILEEAMAEVL